MNKRVNILLTVIGILAALLLISGCGDGREETEAKVLNPFVTDPSGNVLASNQNTQDATPAFEGATHILVGTLTAIDEEEFRIITPNDYTGIRTQVPQITLTLEVDTQGIIKRGFVQLESADSKGKLYYRAQCNGDCQGALSVNALRIQLRDSGGFIQFVSNSNTIETGLASIDGHQKNLGTFNLTMRTLTK